MATGLPEDVPLATFVVWLYNGGATVQAVCATSHYTTYATPNGNYWDTAPAVTLPIKGAESFQSTTTDLPSPATPSSIVMTGFQSRTELTTSTSSPPTTTTSANRSPTNTPAMTDGTVSSISGLALGDKIALGVGIPGAVLAVISIATLVKQWLDKKK